LSVLWILQSRIICFRELVGKELCEVILYVYGAASIGTWIQWESLKDCRCVCSHFTKSEPTYGCS